MAKSRSYIATPPGATIKEQIVDRGMSQKEFSVRMGMSEKHISKLVNGEVQLTIDMARRLEMVLGVPTQFWCNLESIYREKLAKVNEENTMESDVEFAKKFPYKQMVKNGWVEETQVEKERVANLRKYFEVVQLNFLQKSLIPIEIVSKKVSETEKSYYTLVAWSQQAKLEGRKVKTQSIDIKMLVKVIPELRQMTAMYPEEFCPKLQARLAACGIAVVFLPHIEKRYWHGTTFYDGNKIVLGLMVKGKSAEEFWFSLFHELGHIILGHIGNEKGISIEEEAAADTYSEETLLPKSDFMLFLDENNISETTIVEYAKREGVHTGIVLNRLQKYNYIGLDEYTNLKANYVIR